MTPKEKANELFNKMFVDFDIDNWQTKQCALIAVDEILNIDNIKPYVLHKEIIEFYQEVKQQIELL